MPPVRIKEEDVDVDNKQSLSEENHACIFLNKNKFKFKSEGDDSKDIKTELIAFKGSQKTLQIRPLPDSLREEALENEEASTSKIHFRAYYIFTDI
jgi:hypothetical protein